MKQFLKSKIGILLSLSACIALSGCSSTGSGDATTAKQGADDVKKIGILQIVEHQALDISRQGFLDALAEGGFVDGKNILVDYLNAQGDQSNLKTMSQRLVENKSDLIFAIATPSAQSIASETKTIPILITAVTDPEKADIVESNENTNCNVTGTSDLTPVEKQFELLKELFPDAKRVGAVYNSSEPNSQFQIDIATESAKKLGLEFETATVASVNDITQVAEALCEKVDVIYTPTDNMIVSAMPILAKVATDKKVPIVCGEIGGVESGALITDGIDYYELGKLTGEMAIKILNGESNPEDMPIQYLEKTGIAVNKTTAEKLGITIPDEILSEATIIE